MVEGSEKDDVVGTPPKADEADDKDEAVVRGSSRKCA